MISRMKILFLHKQILFPRDTGGKIRVLNVLKHLAKWHNVTYVCNLRGGEEQYLPQMEALGLHVEAISGETTKRGGARFYGGVAANVISSYPFTIERNFDPRIRAKISELLTTRKYDLLVCDTVVMARHTIGLPVPTAILFQHNVEAQILRRHAEISSGRVKRWYMQSQWRKMIRFEKDCGNHFDSVIAVSEQDKILFENSYGWRHVKAIDTAVDEEYFKNGGSTEIPGRVMFLGSMDWMPNQDGVKWFVQHVWPAVRAAQPNASFHIVGRTPSADVRALASAVGVTVVGGVPDVRPHLAEAEVVVVPLLVGGGTRLKIYEAMAMERAVVSTSIGAEGLPIVPGEHYLKADLAGDFATAVIELLASHPLRQRIGLAADQFVRQNYGSVPVARQFEAICASAVDTHHRNSKTSI
jgi:polysaccharide biosynthesis protein PslH